MEKIVSFLEITKLVWSQIRHQIGYITHLNKKMGELDMKAKHLFAQRDDVENITRPTNVATSEITFWLDSVEETECKVNSIQKDRSPHPKNIYSKLTLGKRAGDVIEEISYLSNKLPKFEGKEFSSMVDRVEPQIIEINSSTDSELTLQMILGFIKDVSLHKIGIWGMGGIGKTRFLKLLHNQLEREEPHWFDIVIWVTVSREGSQRKVQNDIAERLKCVAIDASDNQLSKKIYCHLSGKRFLLILDDIWKKIDLSNVGIPILNQNNGCKVLLATRNFGVCQEMETDVEKHIKKLSEDEAWSLFHEKVGDVALSPHIEPIARDIVKRCGGLPLAILVISSSLRKNSDDAVWRNTLRKLQSPSTSQIIGMEKDVFPCLRVSYDQLDNDRERNFFLYCSSFLEDSKILIAKLAEYCWLWGYTEIVGSSKEGLDDGRHMVMKLVDASLLERVDDDGENYVKMHDIIRCFALKEDHQRRNGCNAKDIINGL